MRAIISLIFCIAVIFLTSCGNNCNDQQQQPPPTTATPGTFQYVKDTVLPQCLSCHGSGSSTGYDFSSYSSILASGAIVASNPNSSRFYIQINNGSMPKGGAKLQQVLIDAVGLWIQNGAQNN